MACWWIDHADDSSATRKLAEHLSQKSLEGGEVMDLIISPSGLVSCIYDEILDLASFGPLQIKRASHVEPDEAGNWWADLAPVKGPKLGPYRQRSEALTAERRWLEANLLPR
jgi:hypothetical protein